MTAPKASAVLQDVFRLTNRGTVLVAGQIEGAVHIGDQLLFEGRETSVVGIEMINMADPSQAKGNATVGLLVHDADADTLRGLIGQRMIFHGKA